MSWPAIPPDTILMMAERRPAKTGAERSSDARLRRKLGFGQFRIDLPGDVSGFLVRTGWLRSAEAKDYSAQCKALSQCLCSLIHREALATHRDGRALQINVRPNHIANQNGEITNADETSERTIPDRARR